VNRDSSPIAPGGGALLFGPSVEIEPAAPKMSWVEVLRIIGVIKRGSRKDLRAGKGPSGVFA
jgi:hypothetical protein